MKHFIRATLAATLLVCCLSGAYAQSDAGSETPSPNCFVFVDRNGVETEFFGDYFTFETSTEGTRTIHAVASTDGYTVNITFPSDDIVKIKNEYREMAGIVAPELADPEAELSFSAGTIRVNGAKPGSTLRIFNSAGSLVTSMRLDAGSCVYPLGSLPSGMYIAEIGGLTLKIAKK